MSGHHPTENDHITSRSPGLNRVGLLYIGDVQALQRAETVTFDTREHGSWVYADLFAPLTGEPRIYTASEQRLFPDADGLDRRRRIAVAADVAGFDDQQHWHEHHLPGAAAFTSISPAGLDEVWRSIAAFLRVGDVVRLHWRAGNTTDSFVDPELHRDELSIVVHRGRRRWVFLLDVQVRPGPARMITCT